MRDDDFRWLVFFLAVFALMGGAVFAVAHNPPNNLGHQNAIASDFDIPHDDASIDRRDSDARIAARTVAPDRTTQRELLKPSH
jgi:hypothetical protein